MKIYSKPCMGIIDLRAAGLMDVDMKTGSGSVPPDPKNNTEENGSFAKEMTWGADFPGWEEE